MPDVGQVGQAGLQGWREKVAAAIAPPVAGRSPFDEDQVRAVIGAIFFLLALLYVVKTAATIARGSR